MASPVLSAQHFHTEEAAFEFVEAYLWPNGPVCPFCGEKDRIGRLNGKTTRPGLRKCYACRKPFTVRIGSIFESSHLPLHAWLQVIHLMCASKKGISTRQVQRLLKCSMRTAWHLTHRVREIMAPGIGVIGGPDQIVEIDETVLSPSHKTKNRPPVAQQKKFVSLVERGGKVRSRVITGAKKPISVDIHNALYNDMHRGSVMHTDGAQHYKFTGLAAKHESVDHNKEYARTAEDGSRVHTNSAEGYFSIFKRGLVGTYQHMSEQHLHRYLAEFDFRMSNRVRLGIDDEMRTVKALQGAAGKRLTYRTPDRKTA